MQIDEKSKTQIKSAAQRVLLCDYELLLFGSRAKDRARQFSDIDIAIDSKGPITLTQLLHISGELDDSNLPYKVDIVDLSKVTGSFRDNIIKEGIKL